MAKDEDNSLDTSEQESAVFKNLGEMLKEMENKPNERRKYFVNLMSLVKTLKSDTKKNAKLLESKLNDLKTRVDKNTANVTKAKESKPGKQVTKPSVVEKIVASGTPKKTTSILGKLITPTNVAQPKKPTNIIDKFITTLGKSSKKPADDKSNLYLIKLVQQGNVQILKKLSVINTNSLSILKTLKIKPAKGGMEDKSSGLFSGLKEHLGKLFSGSKDKGKKEKPQADASKGILSGIGKMFSGLSGMLKGPLKMVGFLGKMVKGLFSKVFDILTSLIPGVGWLKFLLSPTGLMIISFVSGLLKRPIMWLWDKIKPLWENVIKPIWEYAIKPALNFITDTVWPWFKDVLQVAVDGLLKFKDWLEYKGWPALQRFFSADYWKDVGEKFMDWGKTLALNIGIAFDKMVLKLYEGLGNVPIIGKYFKGKAEEKEKAIKEKEQQVALLDKKSELKAELDKIRTELQDKQFETAQAIRAATNDEEKAALAQQLKVAELEANKRSMLKTAELEDIRTGGTGQLNDKQINVITSKINEEIYASTKKLEELTSAIDAKESKAEVATVTESKAQMAAQTQVQASAQSATDATKNNELLQQVSAKLDESTKYAKQAAENKPSQNNVTLINNNNNQRNTIMNAKANTSYGPSPNSYASANF